MKKPEKHGMAESPEYWVWVNMRARCLKPNNPQFHRYGGRGITIHPPWAENFSAFIADVGPRPSSDYSIERIDNDKGYEPANVRWATKTEQARNTSRNRWIEIDGERKLLIDWARERDIDVSTILHRIEKGMSERDAVLKPPAMSGRRASASRRAPAA